ncbi:ABC transporter ATP-binding protein [Paracoccus denitrificans]|jgi:putative spermidine/putrescine transport system ATP-binding protein|uniref:ABC transporter related protein n=1 Tax=Paracoccus denitrificans (strain Pd 1222) TaxID=318586 RepID=A1AZ84_PARDP|nr:ABC transporter ATP-binding protein [Paracoccus denitrificans]ABL68578.1 ABC transporter related protein [Paracoccus denitrificans PD1222]MBB4625696.1 putative spermidine/putrescine transport system ATP-binding protein [Paracoccus denitrificans]MCU7427136.1 ABC transporter ATP-binding protein [Paracoccus denitrificans]QAR26642.1 ABC transporter ATP-binding protein [Paracoccus denitrificans]UPV95590.1 ABC transporter ATP-binding protein [Paracoccus denitrificans]
MSRQPFISFNSVSKSYDHDRWVVEDLCLDVREGEFLTLLGPSGSGKSTTLMMLAGFEQPTTGDILRRGRSLHSIAPHKRNIGIVFQDYALFPHMKIGDNIGYPLRMRGLRGADVARKVEKALDMVDMSNLSSRYPHQLSGGQRQRVALARALVFDPDLVLLDEPLGALDNQLRIRMQAEIKRLHAATGVTFVAVTHDQNEALSMSDRIAIFNNGRVQQIDETRKIYDQPATAFVAQFIGDSNILPAQLVDHGAGQVRVTVADMGTLLATKQTLTPEGANMAVAIRQERIVVSPVAANCDNRFSGQVSELAFLGDQIRVQIHIGDHRINVRRPISEFVEIPTEGDWFEVGWSPTDCWVLPET